jgi:Fe-S oxidoreductase
MKRLTALQHELMCCTGCGYCRQSCPSLDIGGTEVDSGRGRVFLAYGLLTGEIDEDESVIAALQRCPLCGRCEQDCPSKIRIREIIQTARQDLTRLLPEQAVLAQRIRDYGNPFGEETTPTSQHGTGDIAYFAGCVSTYEAPELRDATLSVFDKLGIRAVTVPEICCGSPLERMGLEHQHLNTLAAKFSEAGVATIVTGCPSGLVTLAPLADRFNLYHLTEFLVNKDPALLTMERPLLYHDSSVMGRTLGIYEDPRRLLEKVGGFLEYGEHHELAGCCGGDLVFRAAFPDMATEMAQHLIAEATDRNAIIVTADPQCYRHLREYGEVLDIIQVVDRCLQ